MSQTTRAWGSPTSILRTIPSGTLRLQADIRCAWMMPLRAQPCFTRTSVAEALPLWLFISASLPQLGGTHHLCASACCDGDFLISGTCVGHFAAHINRASHWSTMQDAVCLRRIAKAGVWSMAWAVPPRRESSIHVPNVSLTIGNPSGRSDLSACASRVDSPQPLKPWRFIPSTTSYLV